MSCVIINPNGKPVQEHEWTEYEVEIEQAEIRTEGEGIEFYMNAIGRRRNPGPVILSNEGGTRSLAIRFHRESGHLQYIPGAIWSDCGTDKFQDFRFNPTHEAGGFVLDRAGGLGISDIRDNGIRIIYVNPTDFPIVIVRNGEDVILRVNKSQPNPEDMNPSYYYSPKL